MVPSRTTCATLSMLASELTTSNEFVGHNFKPIDVEGSGNSWTQMHPSDTEGEPGSNGTWTTIADIDQGYANEQAMDSAGSSNPVVSFGSCTLSVKLSSLAFDENSKAITEVDKGASDKTFKAEPTPTDADGVDIKYSVEAKSGGTGVSIDATSGALTVDANATPGKYTVKATSGTISCEQEITVKGAGIDGVLESGKEISSLTEGSSYKWYTSVSGTLADGDVADKQEIANATDKTYKLTDKEVGNYIVLVVDGETVVSTEKVYKMVNHVWQAAEDDKDTGSGKAVLTHADVVITLANAVDGPAMDFGTKSPTNTWTLGDKTFAAGGKGWHSGVAFTAGEGFKISKSGRHGAYVKIEPKKPGTITALFASTAGKKSHISVINGTESESEQKTFANETDAISYYVGTVEVSQEDVSANKVYAAYGDGSSSGDTYVCGVMFSYKSYEAE